MYYRIIFSEKSKYTLKWSKNHNHHYMCYDIKKEIILFDFKSVLWMLKVDFEKHEFLKYYKI